MCPTVSLKHRFREHATQEVRPVVAVARVYEAPLRRAPRSTRRAEAHAVRVVIKIPGLAAADPE